MSIVVPYRFKNTPFGKVCEPIIEVGLRGNFKRTIRLNFLVDSGSDISAVPEVLAPLLGIPLSSSNQVYSVGVNEQAIPSKLGRVLFSFEGWETELPCLFMKHLEPPF